MDEEQIKTETEKETFGENFDQLKDDAKELANLNVSLWKMHVIEKASVLGTYAFSVFLFIAVFDVVLFFLGLSFGIWMGQITGSYALGFLLSALVFIIAQVFIYIFRRHIFSGAIVRKLKDAFFDD